MYKIVNIADLNLATNFIETDKVVEIDGTQTKMRVATNDYAHKSKSYLSDAINTVDSAFNSYIKTIDTIYTTYLTSDISAVYLPKGSAVLEETINTILTSDAFLTKEKCKKIETDCIAYIDELKNKAVSIMMAQLNKSFIAQNSAGKLAYGQKGKNYKIEYTTDITEDGLPEGNDYDFETGEFSLPNLLFGSVVEPWDDSLGRASEPSDYIPFKAPDAWKKYYDDGAQTVLLNRDIEDLLADELSSYLVFNVNEEKKDYKIVVPEGSYDFVNNESIPVAQLVEEFLKRQIKTVIKNVCDKYISKMSSIPTWNLN